MTEINRRRIVVQKGSGRAASLGADDPRARRDSVKQVGVDVDAPRDGGTTRTIQTAAQRAKGGK